jgi:hypothetical protein
MLNVICTHCGKILKIPEEYLGQKGKCNHCQGEITVTVAPPKLSAEAIEAETKGKKAASTSLANLLGDAKPPIHPSETAWEEPKTPQPFPNQTEMKPLAPGWLVVFAIVVIVAFAWIGSSQDRMRRLKEAFGFLRTTKPPAGLVLPSFGKQIVTFDKYQRIQPGMSYQQVKSIIGAEGEEISSNFMEGVPGVMPSLKTVMYQWFNSNGTGMNAMFQNDKLMQKSQFGIR